jgi:hypothetical protein
MTEPEREMIVKDLMAYLSTIPEDANIEVVVDGCWEDLKLNDDNLMYFSSMENNLYFGNCE